MIDMGNAIDREARQDLRRALRALMAGRLSEAAFSDVLDDLYLRDVCDPVVEEFEELWRNSGNPMESFALYRPINPPRFRLHDAAYRQTRAGRRAAARFLLFLQTDAPLVYPDAPRARAFWGAIVGALTLGIVRVRGATWREWTDWSAWPFYNAAFLDVARQTPKLLCGPKETANS